MVALLETDGLTKTFGALVANDGISISVPDGAVRGIIGPNGSGKSTFFNTLTGFYQADGGTVTFDGTDVTGWSTHAIARRGLARTFQIVSPFEDLTVKENLLAVYTPGLRVSREKRDRADEILAFLEIDHIADNEASEMSGGQQKLLELARVLMLDPKCILLDEPTAGVNPALQNRILDRLEEMNRRGKTFIIVEHDMSLIERFADSVTVFDQGRVIAEGSFDEVKGDDRVREAYLGSEAGVEDVLP
ncbi:ABC transporter ATP-binding protein [Salinigranum halophilum]|uniref:ABC transporter ATP-binding protein n=1 Tax=Salinigranum halophilum TaxID=2565931 RepID=UPI001F373C06|nr:ABC transporter ATP-binding protein [Salinigranum halophilum]